MPTHPEPRPDDEGRESELSPTCAACAKIVGFREPVQFWELHDGRRYVHAECIRAAIEQARLTPHPAPLGATDEGLREAAERVLEEQGPPLNSTWVPVSAGALKQLRASLQAGG